MSDIIKAVQDAVWGTRFYPPVPASPSGPTFLQPSLIVMSRASAREIMRSQGSADIEWARAKTDPDRIYGVRIAYDDSLALGEFLPAVIPDAN